MHYILILFSLDNVLHPIVLILISQSLNCVKYIMNN